MAEPVPKSWQQLEALLDLALDRPPGERRQLIAEETTDAPELRRQALRLLDFAEIESSWLDEGAKRRSRQLGETRAGAFGRQRLHGPWIGRRVGAYEIAEVLGSGGMGTVFRATRVDGTVQQEVAIKVAPAMLIDAELEARFEREMQILSRLRHPLIARFLDAGVTSEGLPYLVAELVEGEPIDAHCERHGIGLEGRLELLLRVCSAVEYLHTNLVVHRDLKPSNILVTAAGEPRLLDFGIAAIVTPDPGSGITELGRQPLSLDSASPEQLRGDAVNTTSDVYSLGVLLCRLLTGEAPYRADRRTPARFLEVIELERAPAPSRAATPWAERLAGDLDAIALHALRADPAERYSSVAALADDLRRFLQGRPVSVRLPTIRYRTWKFVRRHRLAMAVSTLVVALVAAAIGAAVWQYRIAERQRSEAQLAARTSDRVTSVLQSLFDDANPRGDRGTEVSARELLVNAVDRVKQTQADPEVLAALLAGLGRSLYGLGDPAKAEELQREALALRLRLHGDWHSSVGESHAALGQALNGLGRYDQALAEHQRALEIFRRVEPGSENHAAALSAVAVSLGPTSPATERYFLEALEIMSAEPTGSELAPTVLAELSSYYDEVGRRNEAIELGKQALAAERELGRGVHPNVASMQTNLAIKLFKAGRFEEAERFYDEGLRAWEQIYNPEHVELIRPLTSYGRLLLDQGHFEKARPVLDRAVSIALEQLDELHFTRLAAETNLASLSAALGESERATRDYRSILRRMETAVGAEHPASVRVRSLYAGELVKAGRHEEAAPLLEAALESQRASDVPPWQLADTLLALGVALRDTGSAVRAEGLLEEAIATRRRALPPDHWQIDEARIELAMLLLETDRHSEAKALLETSAPRLTSTLGSGDTRSGRARALLARASSPAVRNPAP